MLRQLSGIDMVLVGGQAINVWANLYLPRIEALRTDGPFTSKDVDFLGDKPAVKECARRLNLGKAIFDAPFALSSKVKGTSTILKPFFFRIYKDSTWKMNPVERGGCASKHSTAVLFSALKPVVVSLTPSPRTVLESQLAPILIALLLQFSPLKLPPLT